MLRFILIATLLVIAQSFLSSRLSTRVKTSLNGDVFFDNNCDDKLKDPMGRCPGMPGFQPKVMPLKKDQKDFKSFQAAQKALKDAAKNKQEPK